MTRVHLADLGRACASEPRIASGALFGAAVSVATSWVKGEKQGLLGDAALGAGVGVCAALLAAGIKDWIRESAEDQIGSSAPNAALGRVGFAPYPLYAPSLSYPWSEH
jgi:hypothetical protein